MRHRPPGYATVPGKKEWYWVERPRVPYGVAAIDSRLDLPCSDHNYGVVGYDEPLTEDEAYSYEMDYIGIRTVRVPEWQGGQGR